MLRSQQEEMEGASMTILILGLAIFIAAHLVPTFPDFRAAKIAQYGFDRYKLLFSAASLTARCAREARSADPASHVP